MWLDKKPEVNFKCYDAIKQGNKLLQYTYFPIS